MSTNVIMLANKGFIFLIASALAFAIGVLSLYSCKSKESDFFYSTLDVTGENFTNCGMSSTKCSSYDEVLNCAVEAYRENKVFSAYFNVNTGDTYALASNLKGELYLLRPKKNSLNESANFTTIICENPKILNQNGNRKFSCDNLADEIAIFDYSCES